MTGICSEPDRKTKHGREVKADIQTAGQCRTPPATSKNKWNEARVGDKWKETSEAISKEPDTSQMEDNWKETS